MIKTLRQHFFLLVSVIVTMSVASCSPSVPDKYIQPGQLEDILYDYHLSRALAEHVTDDNNTNYRRNLYYRAVLKKHGVTEAEFDSSMVYYYTHAERLEEIYQRVSERMSETAKEMGASVGDAMVAKHYSTTGDTANIWRDATSAVLLPTAPYNRLDFEVKVDTSFHQGDSFMLSFMTDYMYQNGTKDGVAYIAIKYSNDSLEGFSSRVTSSGRTQLRVPSNNEFGIKEIKGFIYLGKGNDDGSTLKLMFVSNINLLRFHKQKEDEKAELRENDDRKVAPQQPVKVDTTKTDTTKKNVIQPRGQRQALKPVRRMPDVEANDQKKP